MSEDENEEMQWDDPATVHKSLETIGKTMGRANGDDSMSDVYLGRLWSSLSPPMREALVRVSGARERHDRSATALRVTVGTLKSLVTRKMVQVEGEGISRRWTATPKGNAIVAFVQRKREEVFPT